jgi:hypothetical protein
VSQLPGLYRFDDADAELSFLPLASRRALDLAGLHLSLEGYRKLALAARVRLLSLGAADTVDVTAVAALLTAEGATTRPEAVLPDPPAAHVPAELRTALGAVLGAALPLSDREWQRFRPLDRYVLVKLAGRGRLEKLARAHAEITASVREQG